MASLAQKMESVHVPRDPDGRVKTDQRDRIAVFSLKENRWLWRAPIDARELVALGQGTFTPESGETPPEPHGLKSHPIVDEDQVQGASELR